MDKETIIKCCEHWVKNYKNKPLPLAYSSVVELLAVLKEHEAKQVIRKQCKKEHDDGSIDYFAEWFCPHCKLLIQRGYDAPWIKYCYKCGKPILWEGR